MTPPSPFRDPSEPIRGLNDRFVGDFWRWAYSDLLSNTNRPILAEYLVGSALQALSCPRTEWDLSDIDYRGRTIEVKSAAYVQSWDQPRPSSIRFDIGKRCRWNEETGRHVDTRCQHADCSVFCLLAEQDHNVVDPFDLAQREFFVLARQTFDERFGDQKTGALSRVEDCCRPVGFDRLAAEVDRVLFEQGPVRSLSRSSRTTNLSRPGDGRPPSPAGDVGRRG